MSAEFARLRLENMQHGLAKPIARVRSDPPELSRRFGLKFENAQDDLDTLEAALICTPTGRQFALVHHDNQPLPGTDILVDERSSDITADLSEFLNILSVHPRELSWTHPDIDANKLTVSHSLKDVVSNTVASIRAVWYYAVTRRDLEQSRAILLIENDDLRRGLAALLHDLGHNVSEGRTWADAQRMILQRRRGIDRIVADNPPPKGFYLPAKSIGRTEITVVPTSSVGNASLSGLLRSDLEHSR
jgi:hypothetical protein